MDETPGKTEIRERLAAVRRLIGGTPLIAVRCRFRGREYRIFAKQEVTNFTGSIKDRMALHILDDAHLRGGIEPGWTIAEATSGNTGISFAAIGRALGHPVRIFMPDWMSRERVLVIQSLGAEIVPVSSGQGGFVGSIAQADRYAEENEGVFLPHQFESNANVEAHYRTTGPEILDQLARTGREPTAFVAGVGTGGTVMGAGRLLRERVPGITIHPLEPANSPTLRTGCRVGKHRIQGISDEFVPGIVNLEELDDIVDVWDGDAILMAQKLAAQLGLAVGISAGANFLGALALAERQGESSVVVTVFCDSNKKYLTTDLCGNEPVRDEYLAPHVELLDWRAVSGR
ncbi:MAG: PLP-dependent cysteine synthase family protein [Planctomycetota bacterium]|nr:PLP-dependent cysteine synthase family protein [Planctomycetota bacterium]